MKLPSPVSWKKPNVDQCALLACISGCIYKGCINTHTFACGLTGHLLREKAQDIVTVVTLRRTWGGRETGERGPDFSWCTSGDCLKILPPITNSKNYQGTEKIKYRVTNHQASSCKITPVIIMIINNVNNQ